jgi:hypothetical protein
VHRNIERAYGALWAEHQRIHGIHVKILAQGDHTLERRLMRGRLEDGKYLDELLDYEEQLPRAEQRCVRKLTRYGLKIEKLLDTLVRFK